MSELVTVTLKMPTDLRDRLKARATEAGTSVSALLIDGVTLDAQPDLQAEIVRLQAEVARLTAERDQWRDKAKAIVGAVQHHERVKAVSTTRITGSHPSGPVYEPKLSVSGTAQPMFRRGSNAEKALKGE